MLSLETLQQITIAATVPWVVEMEGSKQPQKHG
jgi:hypothetical protein